MKERLLEALDRIKDSYDCYYKDEYADEKNTAFGYIRDLIREDAE